MIFSIPNQDELQEFIFDAGGPRGSEKKSEIRIETPHSRQPLVKGERLVRCEVSAAMLREHWPPGVILHQVAKMWHDHCAITWQRACQMRERR